MLVLEFLGLNIFVKILKIPKNYLFPIIVVLCAVGAIGDSNRVFDVWGILLFGLVGYALSKAGFSLIPMILGFILGPTLELNLRKASSLVQYDALSILQHPIAIAFLAVTVITVILNIRANLRQADSILVQEE